MASKAAVRRDSLNNYLEEVRDCTMRLPEGRALHAHTHTHTEQVFTPSGGKVPGRVKKREKVNLTGAE